MSFPSVSLRTVIIACGICGSVVHAAAAGLGARVPEIRITRIEPLRPMVVLLPPPPPPVVEPIRVFVPPCTKQRSYTNPAFGESDYRDDSCHN
jgi:hypothetical protein